TNPLGGKAPFPCLSGRVPNASSTTLSLRHPFLGVHATAINRTRRRPDAHRHGLALRGTALAPYGTVPFLHTISLAAHDSAPFYTRRVLNLHARALEVSLDVLDSPPVALLLHVIVLLLRDSVLGLRGIGLA